MLILLLEEVFIVNNREYILWVLLSYIVYIELRGNLGLIRSLRILGIG